MAVGQPFLPLIVSVHSLLPCPFLPPVPFQSALSHLALGSTAQTACLFHQGIAQPHFLYELCLPSPSPPPPAVTIVNFYHPPVPSCLLSSAMASLTPDQSLHLLLLTAPFPLLKSFLSGFSFVTTSKLLAVAISAPNHLFLLALLEASCLHPFLLCKDIAPQLVLLHSQRLARRD